MKKIKRLSLRRVVRRLDNLVLPPVDLVVGIADSGAVPASLVAAKLGCDLAMIRIVYRGPDNRPLSVRPKWIGKRASLPEGARRILLVDDVSVSGQTMALARKRFAGRQITTCVFKGKADHVLFPEIAGCVSWPWKP